MQNSAAIAEISTKVTTSLFTLYRRQLPNKSPLNPLDNSHDQFLTLASIMSYVTSDSWMRLHHLLSEWLQTAINIVVASLRLRLILTANLHCEHCMQPRFMRSVFSEMQGKPCWWRRCQSSWLSTAFAECEPQNGELCTPVSHMSPVLCR